MYGVCHNKNAELLKLLLEAKLVDQDMLKISNIKVKKREFKQFRVWKYVNVYSLLAYVCYNIRFRDGQLWTGFAGTRTQNC